MVSQCKLVCTSMDGGNSEAAILCARWLNQDNNHTQFSASSKSGSEQQSRAVQCNASVRFGIVLPKYCHEL
eukprot:1158421-Pelagomonas_calceolata.AAC.7